MVNMSSKRQVLAHLLQQGGFLELCQFLVAQNKAKLLQDKIHEQGEGCEYSAEVCQSFCIPVPKQESLFWLRHAILFLRESASYKIALPVISMPVIHSISCSNMCCTHPQLATTRPD